MPDRWTDEREDWRARGWRDHEERDQGLRYGQSRYGEGRSFDEDRGDVFGERDTGAGYHDPTVPRAGGGGYGAGGGYGRGEGYSRSSGGYDRDEDRYAGGYEFGRGRDRGRPGWQDPDYGGVSPAMRQGEYELERNRGRGRDAPRYQFQDYTRGGRFYGDDSRQAIYRREYGQGGVEYGRQPRGYDAGHRGDEPERYAREMNRPAAGGTGGYDYERGYGDGGRRDALDDRDRAGGRGSDFMERAGRKVASWFNEVRRDLGPEGWRESRFEGEREADRGYRGRGPKGYQRSDDRISDEAHHRLTEDSWVDASNISVSVSGGEVTLSGTVDSREAKHRAERCVEEISGVRHVQNNLRVETGNFFTSPTSGYGDSVVQQQMREGGANGGSRSTDESAATRTTTRRT